MFKVDRWVEELKLGSRCSPRENGASPVQTDTSIVSRNPKNPRPHPDEGFEA